MSEKAELLWKGAQFPQAVLAPHGFTFAIRDVGVGSGGTFAWGDFVRCDCRLEFHFRYSLGLVRYHVGDQSASHEAYMRELEVWAACRYPGFNDDPMDAFRDLAHDLTLAKDFLCGTGEVLRNASKKEAQQSAAANTEYLSRAVGDTEKLGRLQDRFKIGRYSEVVEIASTIRHIENASSTIQKMIEIARKRSHHSGAVGSD